MDTLDWLILVSQNCRHLSV